MTPHERDLSLPPIEDFWQPAGDRRTWPATPADITAVIKEATHAEQWALDSLRDELGRCMNTPER